ncbi:hypothetical protein P8C59_006714 [Phyllachora maydis]|uniref:Uncharacterized protein n=1 Tax=Phyllachora maydis TaxID=1825666 RepID=A0AAD9I799_9PEZI|nr:hypothetical protein P8C59_006714 [Phyllachora maydis]
MSQPAVVDDNVDVKSTLDHIIPFILFHHVAHERSFSPSSSSSTSSFPVHSPPPPLLIGLNGPQGIGKSTLAALLAVTLAAPPYDLPTVVLSIDDFYLPRPALAALAAAHPTNALLRVRGQPGTHDVPLLLSVLTRLLHRPDTITSLDPLRLPRYDKAAHGGLGDRIPPSQWCALADAPRLVLLEGWCVGFRALGRRAVAARHAAAAATSSVRRHALDDLLFVDGQLAAADGYARAWDLCGALVHLDAADTAWVYEWRREQEAALRAARGAGAGMTDEEVNAFVDAYYPAYDLYTDRLRRGTFREGEGASGRHLRLVMGRDRTVRERIVI